MTQHTRPETTGHEEKRQHLLRLAECVFYQFNRIFIRHGVLVPELCKILEWTAARAAMHEPEFAVAGRTDPHAQSAAHASLLTGLQRVRLKKIAEQEESPVAPDGGDINILLRILAAWRTEPGYQDRDGSPLTIHLNGRRPSLHQLRVAHASDATTRAIADALVAHGFAAWVGESEVRARNKKIRLVKTVSSVDHNTEMAMAILRQISSDFMHSLQNSFDAETEWLPRFREAYFNDIHVKHAPSAYEFLFEEVSRFNTRCVEGLRKFRASEGEPHVRIGAGSYTFCEAPLFLTDLSPQRPLRGAFVRDHDD